MTCLCGTSMPEVSLYGVLEHVCQRCGRTHALVGKSVTVTVPPGAERIEELEKTVAFLASRIDLLMGVVQP